MSVLAGFNNSLDRSRGQRSQLLAIGVSMLFFGFSIYSLLCFFEVQGHYLRECYLGLILEGLYFTISVVAVNARRRMYLFEPYVIVTTVYALLYYFAPLLMFGMGETDRFGVDVTPYGLTATAFVILGHVAFTLGYFLKDSNASKSRESRLFVEPSNIVTAAHLSFVLWTLFLTVVLVYQSSRGFSVSYILSGGMIGSSDSGIEEGGLQFLSYFSYSLISSWLLIYCYSQNQFIKIITFVITTSVIFFGGTRAAILIPLLCPLVYSYVIKRKSPSILSIGSAVLALVMLFAVMQVARAGVRSGDGFNIAGETLSSLFEPFQAEIDDFKAFYAVLGVVPAKHDYLFGSTMIGYSLVLLVPRALWPGKPYPETYEIVRLAFGDYAVKAGVAYPGIAEYYVEFGVIGIVVCMLILGIVCSWMKGLYINSSGRSLALALYSVLLPALFQFIIRGYMPQNLTMVLFLLFPIYLILRVDRKRSKHLDNYVYKKY